MPVRIPASEAMIIIHQCLISASISLSLGNTYTQFYATTNGLIYFGGGGYYEYSNTSIPNSSTPNNAIYAFWMTYIPMMTPS